MQAPESFVGVDVSKAELVIAKHDHEGWVTVPNDSSAILRWLRTLDAGSVLAMESTGRHHRRLADLAVGLGMTVFVLNARDVYFYAKALGARGKTDRVDARLIARYLAEHHRRLHPYSAPTELQSELQQLLRQRWTVVTKRVALQEALQDTVAVAPAVGQLNTAFTDLLGAIDARITELIDTDDQLQHARTLLQSIVGVGPQSSALLSSLLTRLTFASGDALVAYSGLDPRANDSGKSKGKRRLSKRGDPALRRQMYMAAMAACRTKTFSTTYKALRDRGLKTTEALVVLARKLLRIAFAVWSTKTPFDPRRLAPMA